MTIEQRHFDRNGDISGTGIVEPNGIDFDPTIVVLDDTLLPLVVPASPLMEGYTRDFRKYIEVVDPDRIRVVETFANGRQSSTELEGSAITRAGLRTAPQPRRIFGRSDNSYTDIVYTPTLQE